MRHYDRAKLIMVYVQKVSRVAGTSNQFVCTRFNSIGINTIQPSCNEIDDHITYTDVHFVANTFEVHTPEMHFILFIINGRMDVNSM